LDHLLWFWPLLVGGRSHLLRTPPPRSDTAPRISFQDLQNPGPAPLEYPRITMIGAQLAPDRAAVRCRV